MRRAYLLGFFSVVACSADLEIPQGLTVTCATDAECPNGYRCRVDRCEATSGNGGPDVSISAIPRSVGTVQIPVRVYDESGDTVTLKAEVQTSTGTTPITITPDSVPSSTDGVASTLSWDALSYFGGTTLVTGLVVKISGRDNDATGLTSSSEPFTFGNTPPSLTGLDVGGTSVQGLAVVTFEPSDDFDTVSTSLFEFSANGDFTDTVSVDPTTSNGPGTDFPSGAVTGIVADGSPRTIVWNSRELAPDSAQHAAIRLTISDGLATASATKTFALRNQTPPAIAELTVYAGNDNVTTGAFGVTYRLVDEESDVADVRIELSIDNGTTWTSAVEYPSLVSEGLQRLATAPTGQASSGVLHTFVVDATASLEGASSSQVRLRIQARDAHASSSIAETALNGQVGVASVTDESTVAFSRGNLLLASTDSVGTGNFDTDNHPDLVFSRPTQNDIIVVRGTDFSSSKKTIAPSGCLSPRRVRVGDFDSDNENDFATLCEGSTNVAAVFTSVTGSTLNLSDVTVDAQVNTKDLRLGDLNGDGRSDLVIGGDGAGSDAPVIIFLAQSGGFGLRQQLTIPDQGATSADAPDFLGVGDFNGDQLDDIVAASPHGGEIGNRGMVTIWLGSASGVPTASPVVVRAPGIAALTVSDFDLDGNDDVAMVFDTLEAAVWLSVAADIASAPSLATLPRFPVFALPAGPPGGGALDIEAHDFNRDGLPDLMYAYNAPGNNQVRILYADRYGEPGTFLPDVELARYFPTNDTDPSGIGLVAGDFYGDGSEHIVLASPGTQNGPIHYIPVNNQFTAGPERVGPQQVVRTPIEPSAMAVYDANRDGIADLLLMSGDGRLGELATSGVSGFADGRFTSAATTSYSGLSSIGACDLNEDGVADPWPVGDSLVVRMSNPAAGTTVDVVVQASPAPSSALCVDVDGDGHLDLLTVTNRVLGGYRGHGDGTFDAKVTMAGGASTVPPQPKLFDFNNDGAWDLVGQIATGVSVLAGTGGFDFAAPVATSITAVGGVMPADFDADGRDDFVVLTTNNSSIQVYRSNGTTTFVASAVRTTATQSPPVVGDLNDDGFPDVLQSETDNLGAKLLVRFATGTSADIIDRSFGDDDYLWKSDVALGGAAAIIDFTGDGIVDSIGVPEPTGAAVGSVIMHPSHRVNLYGSFAVPPNLGRRIFEAERSVLDRHTTSLARETFQVAVRASGGTGLTPLSQPWEYTGDKRLTRIVDAQGTARLHLEARPDATQGGVTIDLPFIAGRPPTNVRVFMRVRDFHRAYATKGDVLYGADPAAAGDLPVVNGKDVLWPDDTVVSIPADDDGNLATGTGARFIIDATNKRIRVRTDVLGVFQAFETP